jgi:hypothetical protein
VGSRWAQCHRWVPFKAWERGWAGVVACVADCTAEQSRLPQQQQGCACVGRILPEPATSWMARTGTAVPQPGWLRKQAAILAMQHCVSVAAFMCMESSCKILGRQMQRLSGCTQCLSQRGRVWSRHVPPRPADGHQAGWLVGNFQTTQHSDTWTEPCIVANFVTVVVAVAQFQFSVSQRCLGEATSKWMETTKNRQVLRKNTEPSPAVSPTRFCSHCTSFPHRCEITLPSAHLSYN